MCDTLLAPSQWAQNEFGFAPLGDRRRQVRLVKIATQLAAAPGGTLPHAFPDWAELKAAYRFFGQKGVTFEGILAPHTERTRQAVRAPGEYLLIEDTTLLDFSRHRATTDLGVIGNGGGRGFALHTTLAVRVEAWTLEQRPEGTLVGLLCQQCRTPQPAPKGEPRRERLQRARGSQVWAATLVRAGRPPQGAQWIYVADRESDFYEPLHTCRAQGIDFVIRAGVDRRLAQAGGHLHERLAQTPWLEEAEVELRARPGHPARTARVQRRSVRVDLDGPWRPGGWQEPLRDIGVVEVREVDPPAGVEPLHWILLTSLECQTPAQVRRIIGRYSARWWIEEYHKALKTGAGVEESQLEQARRLQALLAVLAVVAVRLLSTKLLARSRPESFEAAESFGPEMLALLEGKLGPPAEGGWTNAKLLVAVARLGGFIGRKSDGMPGWQTIWRGWQRLMWMLEGATLIGA
jgi:hypothetical protein